MCGIIVSTIDVPENSYNLIQKRGPDNISKVTYNNIHFIHFLLHLTGEKTIQPIIDNDNDIICLFNGEIYNYKEILPEAKSDVYSIIAAYNKYGSNFVKYLDGEFVIVLFDFKKNLLFICSDIFKTKPLFYNIDKDNIIISSYESTCRSIKQNNYNQIEPNKVLIFDLNERNLINSYNIYDFDLLQHKNSYDDFYNSLEKAILKRYPENSKPLICLSSGNDSGVIACCLHKFKKNALYISMPKNENLDVILERKNILGESHILLNLEDNEKENWLQYLNSFCEPFNWDWTYNPKVNSVVNGFNMGSMLGKCKIIDFAKQFDSNIRVLYSGIGADEIMAHNNYYSCGYGNVDLFPENLNDVFPWPNFFEGSMKNYLKGDEYVGGSFSYETRYPFCDKDLIQEFLWLKPNLKNDFKGSNYKPALTSYLDKEQFPYHLKKCGFNV
jgi:asparagine synthetase B (glutamine-hydrolysing)